MATQSTLVSEYEAKGDALVSAASQEVVIKESIALLVKAVTQYKLGKLWQKVGDAYGRTSNQYEMDNKDIFFAAHYRRLASDAYQQAGNAGAAIEALTSCVALWIAEDNLCRAGETAVHLASLYDAQGQLDLAAINFERGCDYFLAESKPIQRDMALCELARIWSLLGQYAKAAAVFEELAVSTTLPLVATRRLLNAGLCHLCATGSLSAAKSAHDAALSRFNGSFDHEVYNLLYSAEQAIHAHDLAAFDKAVNLDRLAIPRFEPWQTALVDHLRTLIQKT